MPQQIMLNQRIAACSSVDSVFAEVAIAREQGIPLNSVNIATALHRVARCGNSNVFRDLLNVPEYSFLIEEVSNRLGSDKLSDFKPREIANTAWGVAKAQISAPKIFASICSAALNIGLEHFKPQELSICVWACATSFNSCTPPQRTTLMQAIPTFFDAIEAEIVKRSEVRDGDLAGLSDFKPQELSNTLWSFATVASDRTDIFRVIEQEMLQRGLRSYVPQDIANSVWAFVTAGASTAEVLELVEADVEMRGVRCFKSQELANLVWAFAKSDYAMTSFAALVEDDILERDLSGFMPQELRSVTMLVFFMCLPPSLEPSLPPSLLPPLSLIPPPIPLYTH